ncbi:hypothetical protein VE25_16995 [Devosia geojensis]|uniref:DUF1871 domain-containing protein n=1 Tax=Devosia geojensis TaxID=443610 RepID=A0A0F5FR42_9HYPH|nr:hypothetical protein [Devosia geojensis]KKB10637.1 hypothetical protein VE25_16995 [Devosia geojensis]
MTYEQKLDAVRKMLLQDWDPIGVRDEPAAQDEYDAYLPAVLHLLQVRAPVDEVARCLTDITTLEMGLSDVEERDRAVAARLLALRLDRA